MIIISPILLSMKPAASPIYNGALVYDRGVIIAIGPTKKIRKRFSRHGIIRFENSALLPGLINVHTHLELPPLLEIIRAKAFPDWVLNLIRAKKKLTSQNYLAAVKNNIKTVIETGTTTVGEICTHNISPLVLKQSGARALVYKELIGMDSARPIPGLSALVPLTSASLIQQGISPHTVYTVSESELRRIKDFMKKRHVRIAMHAGESQDEIRLLRGKKSGLEKLYHAAGWDLAWAPRAESPFEYLHQMGTLRHGFLAVHAVHANERDVELIKKTRTAIAHCPRSNTELGAGRMALKKFLDAGITVGLGTDSLASSPSLNMWDEMRYALKIHKKDGISARDIFKLATTDGAAALGMDKEIGSLEPGKKADMIVVPLPSKNTGDIYSDLLRETKSCMMTMVNGKILHKKA